MPPHIGAKKGKRVGDAAAPAAKSRVNESPLGVERKQNKTRNSSGTSMPLQSAKTRTAPCTRCHAHSSVFYCDVCLSERIVSHHVNVRRVSEMRREIQASVEDYFGFSSARLPSGNEAYRRLFAKQAHLEHTIRSVRSTDEEMRRRSAEEMVQIGERRTALDRRRYYLMRARELLESRPVVDNLRQDVKELRDGSQAVALKLAETRAVLSREVLSLFEVEPPTGTNTEARNNARVSRPPRDRERYVPGAFLQSRQASRAMRSDEEAARVSSDDWTIMHVPLVLPSDVKRFERGRVNGAIIHTVHLLHLLAYYLGIALPFVLTITQGLPLIRPNPLWGSGTKQTLHLSSSTYAAFPSPPSKDAKAGQTIGNMGASMISSLGASTMSTLESFVHLPTGANLPWAKNAPTAPTGAPEQVKSAPNTDVTSEKRTSAVKQFYTACTMLAYDIAFLASSEGVKVDLLSAAASPLRLLYKATSSPLLGKKAHTTSSSQNHIDNFLFSHFEFAQLAQLFEPGAAHGGAALRLPDGVESRPRRMDKKVVSSPGPGKAASTIDPILEGSYVDARQAAQSVLLTKERLVKAMKAKEEPSTSRHTADEMVKLNGSPTMQKTASPSTKTEATSANTRRPSTLDFLRTANTPAMDPEATKQGHLRDRAERNKDALSAMRSAHPSSTAHRVTSGTVMFNGREVRATATTDKARRSSSTGQKHLRPSAGEDGEWALV